MSRFTTEQVNEYFEHFTTEVPISGKQAYQIMLDMMYDDPVVMEELAMILLQEVDWIEIARSVNYESGCS